MTQSSTQLRFRDLLLQRLYGQGKSEEPLSQQACRLPGGINAAHGRLPGRLPQRGRVASPQHDPRPPPPRPAPPGRPRRGTPARTRDPGRRGRGAPGRRPSRLSCGSARGAGGLRPEWQPAVRSVGQGKTWEAKALPQATGSNPGGAPEGPSVNPRDAQPA